jgi:site-specific DNA-cytosine methylase
MKVIDLFCGMGGFSEGFKQAGFDVILGIDIWRDALKTFKANQGCDTLQEDIRDIEHLPDCDVIIGSPPCQNFSTLNTKKDVCSGLKLVREFERIIKLNMPQFWIWENVESIKNFYPSAFMLNSWDFGLPQRRKRVFTNEFLSIDKVKELMGFSKSYSISGKVTSQQKQLGNAVCPPVSKVIANAIINEDESD